MSYSCADFQEAIFDALQRRGLIPKGADPEGPSETADLCLKAIEKLDRRSVANLQPLALLKAARSKLGVRVPGTLDLAINEVERSK